MSHEDLNAIKEKLQKLMVKADSAKEIGNAAEAAAFSAKVNDLLTKYNLEMADIEFSKEDEVIADDQKGLILLNKTGRWTSRLLSTLCNYNYCKCVYHTFGRSKEMCVTIIGKKENVEVVRFLYDILKSQLEKIAKNEWRLYMKDIQLKILAARQEVLTESSKMTENMVKKPWKYFKSVMNRQAFYKSFFLGAVVGVNERLESEMKKAEVTYGEKVTALVRVNDAQIERFIAEKFGKLGGFKKAKSISINSSVYEKGLEAGKNASMVKGVATGASVATKFLK